MNHYEAKLLAWYADIEKFKQAQLDERARAQAAIDSAEDELAAQLDRAVAELVRRNATAEA
jgi:membrane protein required for beta-lactamase induction